MVGRSRRRVRREGARVDGVGDDRDVRGVEGRAQDGVLLAGVADADDVVDVAQRELEQLVHQDAGGVREAEELVVGEARRDAHRARVKDRLVREVRECLVAVHDVDALADDRVVEHREGAVDRRQAVAVVEGLLRDVVDLQAVRQPAHPRALAVGVRHHHDLVAAPDQELRELEHVLLHTADVRVEEVRDHQDLVLRDRKSTV